MGSSSQFCSPMAVWRLSLMSIFLILSCINAKRVASFVSMPPIASFPMSAAAASKAAALSFVGISSGSTSSGRSSSGTSSGITSTNRMRARVSKSGSEEAQNPSSLMDDILRGNTTAAKAAVSMLMEVRGTETMETYLNEMIPPKIENYPFWTTLPLSNRLSRRARQLRLRQLLDISTPTTDFNKGDDSSNEPVDDEESKNRRERRALFILLRNISDQGENTFKGISNMLAVAKRDAKDQTISPEEMLKRTPSDLETPKYQVLSSKKGGYEIRRYEPFSICSVTMNELQSSRIDKESASKLSNPQLSGASSFGALAGYLFGKNQEETAMKMTTPVFSEGEGADKKMSFVLPSLYWEKKNVARAPKPLPDSAVKVSSVEGCDRAVLAFGGFGRKADVTVREERLREMLESDGDWKVVEGAPVVLAQYNDPFTPPWKRRNEVSILVEPKK